MKLLSIFSLFVLTTIHLQAGDISKHSLKQALKIYGSTELKKNLKQFITMEDEEQKEIYELCHNASKKAWEIGKKISEKEYKKNEVIKAKVLATTLKTIEFYNHDYSLEAAAYMAKQIVESTCIELAS